MFCILSESLFYFIPYRIISNFIIFGLNTKIRGKKIMAFFKKAYKEDQVVAVSDFVEEIELKQSLLYL